MGQFFGQLDHAGSSVCADDSGASTALRVARSHCQLARRKEGERGFTLIELMVAVMVAAVLLAIAVPSFRSIMVSSRLNTSVNDLIASLNTARMEAIKTNSGVLFCSNSASTNTNTTDPKDAALGSKCGTDTGAVIATIGSTPTVVRAGPALTTGAIQVSGNVQALHYGGDGLARAVGQSTLYGGTVAKICSSLLTSNNIRTVTMTGGSILVTAPSSGGCP